MPPTEVFGVIRNSLHGFLLGVKREPANTAGGTPFAGRPGSSRNAAPNQFPLPGDENAEGEVNQNVPEETAEGRQL